MIGAYLVDTVTLRQNMGSDTHQEPLTPRDVSVRAFIDYGEHRIEDRTGKIVVSMAKILMRPRTTIMDGFAARAVNTIAYEDEIVYPDGTVHTVVKISQGRDFTIRSTNVYVT